MGPCVWLVALFLLSCCITGELTSQEDSGGKQCPNYNLVKCKKAEPVLNISAELSSLQKELHEWMVQHSCESPRCQFCVQLTCRNHWLSLLIKEKGKQNLVGLCSCKGKAEQNTTQWNKCLCSEGDGGRSPPCCCESTSESSENHADSDEQNKNSCHSYTLEDVRCGGKYRKLLKTAACNSLNQLQQGGESMFNSGSTPSPTNGEWKHSSPDGIIIICVVVPICILGLVCIVARICKVKRKKDRKSKETKVAVCNTIPGRKEEDSGHVAYSVTKVQVERPGERRVSIYSAEHVYCYIKDPVATGDGAKTDIQGEGSRDPVDAGQQPKASSAVEETQRSQQQPEEPGATPADQGYSVIGSPATETASAHPRAEPRGGSLEDKESPDQP